LFDTTDFRRAKIIARKPREAFAKGGLGRDFANQHKRSITPERKSRSSSKTPQRDRSTPSNS
jgi:hypothetical protein